MNHKLNSQIFVALPDTWRHNFQPIKASKNTLGLPSDQSAKEGQPRAVMELPAGAKILSA